MGVTLNEVKDFIEQWFHTVGNGGTGDAQARFHIYRDTRLYTGNGYTFTLDEHYQLHQQWTDEKHILGPLFLTEINDEPERVQVTGTVYWQASTKEGEIIKMVVGEHWLIEKTPEGLKFILYVSTSFQPLPDSAAFNL